MGLMDFHFPNPRQTGASGAIRTPNVLKENPDLQSGAANRI